MVARPLHNGAAPCVADAEALAHGAVQEDLFEAEHLGRIWENLGKSTENLGKSGKIRENMVKYGENLVKIWGFGAA